MRKLTLLSFIFLWHIGSCQYLTINSLRGSFHASRIQERRSGFLVYLYESKKRVLLNERSVLNYTDENGKLIIVNDSVIFSARKGFNKPYANLKPIENKNFKSWLYDNKSVMNEKNFIAMLNHIPNADIQQNLKIIRRGKRVRTGLLVASSAAFLVGLPMIMRGALYSSGRNSYPQEERDADAAFVFYGGGLIIVGTSFALSTVIINMHHHRILRRKLVKLYNEQL